MVWRALAKDSAIYGGADLASKVVAFFAFPLIAAALHPTDFGSLELVLTLTTLLGLTANCGLNNALQRFYWDPDTAPQQRPALVSSGLAALAFNCVLALLLGALVSVACAPLLAQLQFPVSTAGLMAALLLMTGTQLGQYLLDVTRLHLAPWRFMMVSLVSRVLASMAGVLAVAWLGWGLDGLLGMQALVALLALPLAMLAVRRDLRLSIDRGLIRQLLQFGHPFVYAGLAYWLFGAMDRWLLASMSSVEEVGLYAVGHRFATIVMFVSLAFGQAWSPLAMKIRAEHPQQYRAIYANVLMVLFSAVLMLSGAVALFSGEALGLLMPPAYAGAALPLAVLGLGVALQATQQVTAVGISLEKQTHLFARLSWLSALMNLLLNLALIPSFGALGSAWATVLTYLALTGAYLNYTQKLHPLPLDWRRMAGLGAAWVVLAIAATLLQSSSLSAGLVAVKLAILLGIALACAMLVPWKALRHAR
jgi:O-antigen/teichoic acid export membrane protein